MRRYYFNILSGLSQIEDQEGEILPDVSSVRDRAIVIAREIMADEVREGRLDLGSSIEVRDETQSVVLTLAFADLVRISFGSPDLTSS